LSEDYRKMTIGMITTLHEILMRGFLDFKYRGEFRNCAVRIGNRTCPNVGKKALEGAVNEWIEKWGRHLEFKNTIRNTCGTGALNTGQTTISIKTWESDEKYKEIQKAHIEFENIHPFVDGNGRIGRMLMNWQALKAWLDPIVIKVEDRFEYYKWFDDKKKEPDIWDTMSVEQLTKRSGLEWD